MTGHSRKSGIGTTAPRSGAVSSQCSVQPVWEKCRIKRFYQRNTSADNPNIYEIQAIVDTFFSRKNDLVFYINIYKSIFLRFQPCSPCSEQWSESLKQLEPLQCPAAVNLFNTALQVEDISPVIFSQYFSVILSFPLSPPFFPGDCSMWQSELCVITQQETISLPHICCQGSAKNGAVLGLSDLTTSHRAPELPTPGWGKSNTTS